ncbi:XRE family transcriptional regulator [Streptomyces sp. NPDC058655]|uniref:XRE family transcriptional regulator n=1 Tax=Streptomyces sp. NPDC058655 TaxID=3346577 RepID=UPI00364CE956
MPGQSRIRQSSGTALVQSESTAEGVTVPLSSRISRRQHGKAARTLADCDRLAAHWGMPVLDLLASPTHALTRLPADRVATGGKPSED